MQVAAGYDGLAERAYKIEENAEKASALCDYRSMRLANGHENY
jgi:hypothetical protein